MPGIRRQRLIIVDKLQSQPLLCLFPERKVLIGREAVDLHMVELTVQVIAFIGKPGHIGKQIGSLIRPIGRVPLP